MTSTVPQTPGATITLQELSARFPASAVRKNLKGFHYVSIDATINRLNAVLGNEWRMESRSAELHLLPTAEITYSKAENPGFLAKVCVDLYALDTARCGVGADYADDPDKAIKTAQAEALKKAGHQFGIGLYLWQADERDLVDKVRAGDLKGAVTLLALIEGVDLLNADTISEHFGFTVEQLPLEETLTAILVDAGLL